jgi:hypothetical protein
MTDLAGLERFETLAAECDGQIKYSTDTVVSPIRKQATDALRRARKLAAGPHRNDLRQLAMGLRRLEKQGFEAAMRDHATGLQATKNFQLGSVGEVSDG